MEIHDEIFRDIQACWQGNATGEQVDRVKKWIEENEENHREYERLSRLYYRLGYAKRWDEIDMRAAGASLLKRISRTRKRKMSRYVWRCVAAACVIVGGMMFLWMKEIPRTGEFPLNLSEVRSGSPKATLVLSDGRHVSLAADTLFRMQVQGTLLKEDAIGGLKYEIPDSLRDISRGQAITYNRLVVPRGGEYTLVLADGTTVYLNAESELRFPKQFRGKKRKVYLTGEGYFDVQRNEKQPFIVEAQQVAIRVLGTSFGVRAYTREVNVLTTLVQGRVNVEADGQQVELNPGQQADFNRENDRLTVAEVDVEQYVGWKDGRLVFDNKPLEFILEELGRWYSFDVFYTNKELKEIPYSLNIKKHEDIAHVLKFIERTGKVKFEVNKNMIIVK